MFIDSVYQSVQARLNKEQLGYLKPLYFNLFVKNAQRRLVNKLLTDVRTSVRKANWMLDGRNLADYSEHITQLLEYYSDERPLRTPFGIPNNVEFIEDIFYGDVRVDKIDYSDLKDLQRNIYAKPTECSPKGSKVGNFIKIQPTSIKEIQLHFIRKPKTPKWTFVEFQDRPMFNPDADDFQDIDMPEWAEDDLVSLVTESASKYLRQFQLIQAENQDQAQEFQNENKQ